MGLIKKITMWVTGLKELKLIEKAIPGLGDDDEDEGSENVDSSELGDDMLDDIQENGALASAMDEGSGRRNDSSNSYGRSGDVTQPDPIEKLDDQTVDVSKIWGILTNKIALGLYLLVASAAGFMLSGPLGALVAAGGLIALGSIIHFLSIKQFAFISIALTGIVVLGVVFGAGAGYGGLVNDIFGGYTSGLADVGGNVGYQVKKVTKTLTCFGSAGCIREWQLNNTRRPGSEDVGETYRLSIENKRVYGGDNGVDVAYQTKDSPIPVYFLLKNARHGLKGIDARNVFYRLKVRDPQLVGSGTVLCSTKGKEDAVGNGWLPLNKFREDLNLENKDYDRNTLLPGEAVSPLNYDEGNQLTLEECGLLQPSAGSSVEFVLQIKYDYSSKSTLKLRAMSRDHRRSQNIPIEFKRSETADTPVETYIQARSPVLFQSFKGQGRRAIPFQARIGVSTDERNIEFRVHPDKFVFEDSSLTIDTASCSGLKEISTESNTYTLSGQAKKSITSRQQSGDWFSKKSQPPPASCTFRLQNPEEISPTGETLTMSADVSYTVKQEAEEINFKTSNTLCTSRNCPMLVPLDSSVIAEVATKRLETMDPTKQTGDGRNPYWTKEYALCNRPQDAQSGCSTIKNFSIAARTSGPSSETTVRQGDLALKLDSGMKGKGNNLFTEYVKENIDFGGQVISISPRELREAWQGNKALNRTGTGEGSQWVLTEYIKPKQNKETSSTGSNSDSSSGTTNDALCNRGNC